MPLFIIISGYVYATAYFNSEGEPYRKRIYRQSGNMVIVYVLFSIPYGLIKVIFSRYTNKPVGMVRLFLILVKPIDLYWYLYVLILLYLLFSMPVFRNADQKLMICVLGAVAFCSEYVPIGWFQIPSVLYYGVFFYIGFSNRLYSSWLLGKKQIAVGSFAVSILLCVLFWDKNPYTVREEAVFLNSIPVANVVIAIGISLMLWYLFQNVKRLSENRFLSMFGRYSLEIYVIHCFFTAGFRAVFSRVGVSNAYVSLVLNLALSTAIPLLGAFISKRLGIHDLIFRPVNYINSLKSKQP